MTDYHVVVYDKEVVDDNEKRTFTLFFHYALDFVTLVEVTVLISQV